MTQTIIFVMLGLVVGALAGLLGIGGAIFVVPVLVYVFGWEQHLAQGTTLAMLIPPIGILAAWKYYQAGNIDFRVAGLLCIGFFVGGYAGGYFANLIPSDMLRRIFGVAMLLIAIKMILGK
jgi:uncharacterized membrane protein YfcA